MAPPTRIGEIAKNDKAPGTHRWGRGLYRVECENDAPNRRRFLTPLNMSSECALTGNTTNDQTHSQPVGAR